MLGEARTAVAARPAMVVAVASTGRVGGRVASSGAAREGRVQANQGRGFWAEARRVAGQVAPAAYGVASGRGAARTEVEEAGSGSSVIFSKFKIQLCKL